MASFKSLATHHKTGSVRYRDTLLTSRRSRSLAGRGLKQGRLSKYRSQEALEEPGAARIHPPCLEPEARTTEQA